MDAIQAPRDLPGKEAGAIYRKMAPIYGAFVLLYIAFLAYMGLLAGQEGGHLPWSVVQWAAATPGGVLVLIGLCGLFVGLPLALGQPALVRYALAQAVDVTDLPFDEWPMRPPRRAPRPLAERWLGRGRRRRLASMLLLGVGALVVVALAAGFVAAIAYTRPYIGGKLCTEARCPPVYPIGFIAVGSWPLALMLMWWAYYRQLRRLEQRCGVWFRWRGLASGGAPTYYVRRPGVTAQTAAAALARSHSADEPPIA